MMKENNNENRESSSDKLGYILDEELIGELAREYGLSRAVAKRGVESVFDLAKKVFVKNGLMRIRGFGLFTAKNRKVCKMFDRTTGQTYTVPMVKVVKFAPSQVLKDEINHRTKDRLFKHSRSFSKMKRELKKVDGFASFDS